jgi:hypothetical protein
MCNLMTSRSFAIFALISAAFWAAPLPASALTNLTREQVVAVCGPDLKSDGANISCTKKCGNGKDTCIYACSNKTGVCSGHAVTTSTKAAPQPTTSLEKFRSAGALARQ